MNLNREFSSVACHRCGRLLKPSAVSSDGREAFIPTHRLNGEFCLGRGWAPSSLVAVRRPSFPDLRLFCENLHDALLEHDSFVRTGGVGGYDWLVSNIMRQYPLNEEAQRRRQESIRAELAKRVAARTLTTYFGEH